MRAVAISPDGTWLATVGTDATVRIWSRLDERVGTLAHAEGPLNACAWASDSRTLAVAGQRGVYLFELRT